MAAQVKTHPQQIDANQSTIQAQPCRTDSHRLQYWTNNASTTRTALQTLALLHHSRYDPAVLARDIDNLIEQIPSLDDTALHAWREALARTWENYSPSTENDFFYDDIGRLAAQLGDLGMAKHVFKLGLSSYGDNAELMHHLAYCEAMTGHVRQALQTIERAIALDSEDSNCVAFHALLSARLQRWHTLGWYHSEIAGMDGLTLEPLGAEHVAFFRYQFRDPHIAEMTRLPELQSDEEVITWIEQQSLESGRTTYAVMHERWGFVGVVSQQFHDDAGYLYFWIGADFQDAGLGRQAARLFFKQAAMHGVSTLFTSVFVDNLRSIRALSMLGFAQLPVTAPTPDDDLRFFYLDIGNAETMPCSGLVERLQSLCAVCGTPVGLVAL